jgi:hypothetical protein
MLMVSRPQPPIPEQGQLVTVRQRRYVVTEVLGSALPPDVLRAEPEQPHHLVTLAAVEAGALAESLQVVWELEPAHTSIQMSSFPDLWGSIHRNGWMPFSTPFAEARSLPLTLAPCKPLFAAGSKSKITNSTR